MHEKYKYNCGKYTHFGSTNHPDESSLQISSLYLKTKGCLSRIMYFNYTNEGLGNIYWSKKEPVEPSSAVSVKIL